ncbi:hypothetical protein [Synechococcus sp. MW101C3]|uniref:hypothetical protein n=1 Tax=Synechococcus sp. MW101C3 TaxID=210768 RepID=UPI000B998D65|nr:hypothetical protein [Synechococcus sp. MW101C3]
MADLLELGRRGHHTELAQHAAAARSSAAWSAAAALELACAWLLAGDLRQADLAVLEADQCDPSLGLVPDVWGLWPAPPAQEGAERQQALAWAERCRAWRRPDPQALWQQLLPRLQAHWKLALEPDPGDLLLILSRTSEAASAPLDPPLQPELARLVGDAEIAAEPAASNRYWQLLASLWPQWALARIRAADLALARGELEASGRWLQEPSPAAQANPWFHDVVARHAVQRGAVDAALDAWAEAIRMAQADASTTGLAELFEQRRREARRGPGVLQVRSLANRGEPQAAGALLERLLADDPQWQPLRSLKEQLRAGLPSGAVAGPADPPDGMAEGRDAGPDWLDRATARLKALGVATPPLPPQAPDADIDAITRRLSDYEARFALA